MQKKTFRLYLRDPVSYRERRTKAKLTQDGFHCRECKRAPVSISVCQ